MLMASLHSGEFATLVISTENLSLAALNIFFMQLGGRACLVYVLYQYKQLPIDWQNVEQPCRHLRTNLQGRKTSTEVLI